MPAAGQGSAERASVRDGDGGGMATGGVGRRCDARARHGRSRRGIRGGKLLPRTPRRSERANERREDALSECARHCAERSAAGVAA